MTNLISVRNEIASNFPGLVGHVCDASFVFWLGSGISTGRVPRLGEAILRVVAYLQAQSKFEDPLDVHYVALKTIVESYFPADEEAAFALAPSTWTPVELAPAIDAYSNLFQTQVGDEPLEYLLLSALDLPETYGSDSIEPSLDHYLLGLMILEGVLPNTITANWDALLEKAVHQLTRGRSPLGVRVSNASFQQPEAPAHLYKLHGCASLVREDPANAEYLVVRQDQIERWATNPKFDRLVARAKTLAIEKRAGLLGLSAQDVNIRATFKAAEGLSWPWKADDQACVVMGRRVSPDQQTLLGLEYKADFPTKARSIVDGSLLPHYGEPVIGVLLVEVLEAKLIALGSTHLQATTLAEGSKNFTQKLLHWADDEPSRLFQWLVFALSPVLATFRGLETSGYQSLFDGSPASIYSADPNEHSDHRSLAATLSLLAIGDDKRDWSLVFGGLSDSTRAGTLAVLKESSEVRFLFADERPSTQDRIKGMPAWTSATVQTILIHTEGERPVASSRRVSSSPGSGRHPGKVTAEVWMSEIWSSNDDSSYENFRKGASL